MSVAVKKSPLSNNRAHFKRPRPSWTEGDETRKMKSPLNRHLPNGYHQNSSERNFKKFRKSFHANGVEDNGNPSSVPFPSMPSPKQLPLQEQRSKLPIAKGMVIFCA
jgi:hypothetical protein